MAAKTPSQRRYPRGSSQGGGRFAPERRPKQLESGVPLEVSPAMPTPKGALSDAWQIVRDSAAAYERLHEDQREVQSHIRDIESRVASLKSASHSGHADDATELEEAKSALAQMKADDDSFRTRARDAYEKLLSDQQNWTDAYVARFGGSQVSAAQRLAYLLDSVMPEAAQQTP